MINNKNENLIKIVEAIPDDAKGITTVLYKTWLDTYPNEEIGITKEDVEDSYKDAFTDEKIKSQKERIANTPENQRLLVAKNGTDVIGIATMIRNDDNNQLRTIYMLPEYQGKGVGSMLWNEIKKFCDPLKDTIVQVATYNKNAVSFYEKLGFVDTGKRWSDEKWRMRSGATIPEMEMIIKAKNQKDWSECYEITKAKPPSKLLVKALEYVASKGKAIDIGAGALKDTRYLLEQGFEVTAIDKSPLMEQEAKALGNNNLHASTTAFEDFAFPENEYDIANAMFALPFTEPAHFEKVLSKIKSSLKKGGIFCGQFFGPNDEWSKNPKMTFHTEAQAKELFTDLEILSFKEVEEDSTTANGTPKHWHIFHIIAKK